MQMERLTSSNFDKMIIESIDEVYCIDKKSGDILFWFDQIKSGEITSEADVVYAEGRQGVQLAAFDRNKTAGFTCENGYVQASALALQLGTSATAASEFEVFDTVTLDTTSASDGVTVKDTPKEGGTIKAYKLVNGEKSGDAIPCTLSNGKIKIDGAAADETYLISYTATAVNGKRIVNAGDKFSKNIKLIINFVAQEPCSGNKYLMQCVFPNAKVSTSFSLSAGDDPAVHNFEATALLDVCSTDKELFHIDMV